MEPAVTIREARGREDYDACVDLQRRVWGLSDLEITSAIQLIATVHAGGLLLVAEAGSAGIVGFSYGFAAWSEGASHVHSDMLAVLPDWQGRGVGLRLKWAQREAVLARGLGLVTWTFDPMRAKNARLNLRRLGATAREFLPDLYGRTSSALHHGLATDRLLARWELRSPSVRRLAAGKSASTPQAPAARLNDVRLQGGLLLSSEPRLDLDAPAPAARDPRRLGRGVPRRRRPRTRVAARRAARSRVGLRAGLRGHGRRDTARRRGRRLRPGAAHSEPVAAGSCGSEDHSLHEPA